MHSKLSVQSFCYYSAGIYARHGFGGQRMGLHCDENSYYGRKCKSINLDHVAINTLAHLLDCFYLVLCWNSWTYQKSSFRSTHSCILWNRLHVVFGSWLSSSRLAGFHHGGVHHDFSTRISISSYGIASLTIYSTSTQVGRLIFSKIGQPWICKF